MAQGLESVVAVVEAEVLAGSGGRRTHNKMLWVRHRPSPFPWLHRLVFALEASFHASVTLGTFLVALLLLFLAAGMSDMIFHVLSFVEFPYQCTQPTTGQ